VKELIIAIDGPVGSGKSTLARRVAALLGYVYIDTGAMYRSVALKAQRRGVPLDDGDKLAALAAKTRIDLRQQDAPPDGAAGGAQQVLLDGEDVTALIRTPEVAQAASKVAMQPGVRRVLVVEQRRAGERGGVVMEGRDIGTVVFPNAEVKIFLDAAPEARGLRRFEQLGSKPEIKPADVIRDLRARDERDRNRADSPLKPASDAVFVDSTNMTLEEAVRAAEEIVAGKLAAK
jgi:CMP/dCMP kinase